MSDRRQPNWRRLSPHVGNIFHAYRGASTRKGERSAQLEDNVTKALVNTLLHMDGSEAINGLLDLFGIIPRESNFHFDMQTSKFPLGDAQLARRSVYLLGVVPSSVDPELMTNNTRGDQGRERIADAWIWDDKVVIAVEAKVAGNLDDNQWKDYVANLERDAQKPLAGQLRCTWDQVRSGLKRAHTGSPKDSWLSDQFCNYLEVNQMVSFSGIPTYQFDYF